MDTPISQTKEITLAPKDMQHKLEPQLLQEEKEINQILI